MPLRMQGNFSHCISFKEIHPIPLNAVKGLQYFQG